RARRLGWVDIVVLEELLALVEDVGEVTDDQPEGRVVGDEVEGPWLGGGDRGQQQPGEHGSGGSRGWHDVLPSESGCSERQGLPRRGPGNRPGTRHGIGRMSYFGDYSGS